MTDFGTMRVASPASVPETDTAIRLRAAEGGRLTVRQGRGTVSIPHGRQHGSNMRDARAHVVTLFPENSIRKDNFVLHLNVFKCILDYSNKEILYF